MTSCSMVGKSEKSTRRDWEDFNMWKSSSYTSREYRFTSSETTGGGGGGVGEKVEVVGGGELVVSGVDSHVLPSPSSVISILSPFPVSPSPDLKSLRVKERLTVFRVACVETPPEGEEEEVGKEGVIEVITSTGTEGRIRRGDVRGKGGGVTLFIFWGGKGVRGDIGGGRRWERGIKFWVYIHLCYILVSYGE